jgi:ParB/RepB/Spo0J family partition protein
VLLRKGANGRYTVIAGHIRIAAAKAAGLQLVPAIVDDGTMPAGNVLLFQLVENLNRNDLHSLDVGAAVDVLITRHGMTQSDVARQVGRSDATVSKLLQLHRALPPELKEAMRSGKLGFKAAYAKLVKLQGKAGEPSGGAKSNRKKVTLRLDKAVSLAIVGRNLTLASLVGPMTKLIEKMRYAHGQGVDLAAFKLSLGTAKGSGT